MARGKQHIKRRPPANAQLKTTAAAPKRPQRPAYEDQLFFGRLRSHAKWMFALLALAFGISFVALGVGSGSTGISDVLQSLFSGTSSGGASLSSLEKKTIENPKSPKAWRDYATRLEQKSRPDDAITALTRYTEMRPKDSSALSELAGLELRRAQDWQTVYLNLQATTQALAPASLFAPKADTPLGKAAASLTNPLAEARSAQNASAQSNAYSRIITLLGQRLDAYKKLAKLTPKDAVTQYALAQAAQDAQDTPTAISAYRAFLKLAPADSQAPLARKTLAQLVAQQKAAGVAPNP